jgi:hypothetical protein
VVEKERQSITAAGHFVVAAENGGEVHGLSKQWIVPNWLNAGCRVALLSYAI